MSKDHLSTAKLLENLRKIQNFHLYPFPNYSDSETGHLRGDCYLILSAQMELPHQCHTSLRTFTCFSFSKSRFQFALHIWRSSSNPCENFQSMKQPLRVRRTPKSKFETAPTISLQKFFLTVFVSVDAVKDMFRNIVIVVTKALVSSPQSQIFTHCYLLMERVSIPSQNLQRLLIQTARPWPREKRAAVFAKNLVLEKA